MKPNPRRMADVIRMPGAPGGAAPAVATASVAGPEEPPEPRESGIPNRDKIAGQIEAWEAPILSDDIVETMATIFLMQPGHECMPFFLWLEGKLK